MTLSPFVFEQRGILKNSAGINCFDEPSPCVLEQYSQCVIQLTNDQSKYVPWLMCMDAKGENAADVKVCAEAHGISYEDVSKCQKEDGNAILKKLVKQDSSVDQTPTVKINGKAVGGQAGPSFSNVKAALCKADPSLKGCASDTGASDAVIV